MVVKRRLSCAPASKTAPIRSMVRFLWGETAWMRRPLLAAAAVLIAVLPLSTAIAADPATVARGKYLVTIAGCNDCHTPGYFLGKPDMARFLGGSEVGFELPGLGVFYGPNLTPDKAT